MPKENKHSRGRRKEEKDKKRKRETADEETIESKRQKSQEPLGHADQEVSFIGLDNTPAAAEDGMNERPFYGMLEDEEQEYFRRADELLELNDFPSPEERTMFLENVFREADGKELKIACSQSCSRLMERLVLLSTTAQKKELWGKFAGNFAHLVQHRFASHCCETLFVRSAPVVTMELTGDVKEVEKEKVEGEEVKEVLSMENLFLQTLDELEGQMTFLLTDRFASHTLRVLLVILSGRPLEISSTNSLIKSKKKEKVSIANMDTIPTELSLKKRAVPESFQFAVEKILSDTIATMDASFIRILATHPTGNPTLQLILELELTNPNSKKGNNSDKKTIISALLPDEIGVEGNSSTIFINGILYDQIGSRLLETICTHAPGKLFKQIYKTIFKERIAGLARNEISSYVVMKVLERLSKEDLIEAVEQISPQILGLVERSRTTIIKTLLERCQARKAEKSVKALTEAIGSAYGSDPSTLVLKMACISDISALIIATAATPVEEEAEEVSKEAEAAAKPKSKKHPQTPAALKTTPQQTHGSLLAQSMLSILGAPSELIQNSLLTLPASTLLALALYHPTAHIIQAALNPATASPTFRRKFINTFLFTLPTTETEQEPSLILALSPTGSHTLDALLTSTSSTPSIFILTERIALSLSHKEVLLRDSFTGRIVWRNWYLDLFKRRRGEWVNTVKELGSKAYPSLVPKIEEPPQETPVPRKKGEKKIPKPQQQNKFKKEVEGPKKSAIQLAREKFAKGKLDGSGEKRMGGKWSGKGGKKGKGDNPNEIEVGDGRVGV